MPWLAISAVALATTATYLLVARSLHLHQGRARSASLEEMVLLGIAGSAAGFVVFLANLVAQWVPRSIPAAATMSALVLAAWGRTTWRRLREREDEGLGLEHSTRVLVVGAGDAGTELLGSMISDPARTWWPVGLLDDDPRRRHRQIRHVPVLGTTCRLGEFVSQTGRRPWPSPSPALLPRRSIDSD